MSKVTVKALSDKVQLLENNYATLLRYVMNFDEEVTRSLREEETTPKIRALLRKKYGLKGEFKPYG